MYANLSDNQLIRKFVDQKDEKAFEALVRRHYDAVHKRLLMHTKNASDAEDLSQTLWIKILGNLSHYKDSNKFPHFINTVATNLLRDHWRKQGVRNESSLDKLEEEGLLDSQRNIKVLESNPTEHEFSVKAELEHLTKTLIPQLPTDLRTIFLLKHESEYWDEKQPFQWQHLADLNSLELDRIGELFQSARDKLISNVNKSVTHELDSSELHVFLVWTQTQRINKSKKFTEEYFADLLSIPLNTFKSRYRKSVQILNDEMKKFTTA